MSPASSITGIFTLSSQKLHFNQILLLLQPELNKKIKNKSSGIYLFIIQRTNLFISIAAMSDKGLTGEPVYPCGTCCQLLLVKK